MPFLPGASLGRQCHWPALYPTWRERPGRGLPFDGMDRVSRRLSEFRPISSPAFWPYAYGQISAALAAEKRIRQDRVYKLLSLDAPIAADSDECLLQRLPARQGDFTNSVLFWDYIRRLPRRLFQLAWRLVNRDSLEEARSAMGLTEQELCLAVGQLRDALTRYFTI